VTVAISERIILNKNYIWMVFHQWVYKCFDSMYFRENDFEQKLHLNGFSPMWEYRCSAWLDLRENDLKQTLRLSVISQDSSLFTSLQDIAWKNKIFLSLLPSTLLCTLSTNIFSRPCVCSTYKSILNNALMSSLLITFHQNTKKALIM
jgi:hypothetical protein